MNSRNLSGTVETRLESLRTPVACGAATAPLEDLDVETSRAVAPGQERRLRVSLLNDLKLLFAALGAGGSAVPMGDNRRAARMLANYAESLRDH